MVSGAQAQGHLKHFFYQFYGESRGLAANLVAADGDSAKKCDISSLHSP
jgi:hypothetical protein